jgi:hypothetical protein
VGSETEKGRVKGKEKTREKRKIKINKTYSMRLEEQLRLHIPERPH